MAISTLIRNSFISALFQEKTAATEDAKAATGNLLDNFLVTLASWFPGYTPTVSSITLANGSTYAVQSAQPTVIATAYGHLTVLPNGKYSYSADNANSLGAGATATETITFRVSAGSYYTTASIKVSITGTNDVPVVAADSGNLQEGATLAITSANGVLANDRDVDSGDTLKVVQVAAGNQALTSATDDEGEDDSEDSQVGERITGTYGHLTLNADGSYTYKADTTQANALKAGQTAADVFTYQVSDGHGGLVKSTLTLTVTGTNDGPLAVNDRTSVSEGQTFTMGNATGALSNDLDPDGDALTVTGVTAGTTAPTNTGIAQSITGTYGHLTLNANGSYTYKADTELANGLEAEKVATEVFTYRISDGKGGTSTATLTFAITGVNDGPTASADTASVKENGKLSEDAESGVLQNDRDVDGDKLTVTGVAAGNASPVSGNLNKSVAGTYGTLTLHAEGNYEYKATNAAANRLAAGQTATEVFSYRISDGQGGTAVSTLVITVTGQNDGPTAVADTSSLSEGGTLTRLAAQGLLSNDQDPDTIDHLTVVGVATGSNTPNTTAIGQSLTGTYGHLTVNADGSYTYKADTQAAANLSAGQTATEVFSYRIADSSGAKSRSTLTITLTGEGEVMGSIGAQTESIITPNTPPVAAPDMGQVNEGASVVATASGVLANDTDANGNPLTVTGLAIGAASPVAGNLGIPVVGTYGHLTLSATGSYTYTADTNAANGLKAGQTVTDTFTYQISDGKGGTSATTLTLTVTGTNDTPIATADTGAVQEDSTLSVTSLNGVLANDTDVDGDTLAVSAVGTPGALPSANAVGQSLSGSLGHLTLRADGSYTYVADNATALKVGQIQNEVFVYQTTDGHGGVATATLTIAVTGTNDQPQLGLDTASLLEDASLNRSAIAGVLANDSDPDQDALVVTGVSTGNAFPSAQQLGVPITGTYGHLTLQADGSYSYVADTPAANALKAGQIQTDSFSYQVSDGHGGTATSTLVVTITGTNDTPMAMVDSHGAQEDTGFTVAAVQGLLSNDSDADGDLLHIAAISKAGTAPAPANLGQPIAGNLGHLTVNADGSYSYTADTPAANALKAGQTSVDAFTYQISDGQGGSSSATLSITVTGTNDGPIAQNDSLSLAKGSTVNQSIAQGVLANDSDVDGDTLLVVGVAANGGAPTGQQVGQAILGTYGHLTLNANGSYSYTADTPAALALGIGQTRTETFTYQIADGHGGTTSASLLITVSGSNNGPNAQADIGSVQENGSLSTTTVNGLLANDSDANGDILTVTGVASGTGIPNAANLGQPYTGIYGHLTLNGDGSYTYAADTPAADGLKQGQVVTEVFSYSISDGAGGLATTTLTLSVTGTNDLPLVTADTSNVLEDTTVTRDATTGVLSNDTDLDHDILVVAAVGAGNALPTTLAGTAVQGLYGQLLMNADGSYSYTANTPAAEALKLGEVQSDLFRYQISDGQGGTAITTLTILVTGTNDIPVASADQDSVQENATLTVTSAQGLLANDADVDGDPLTITAVALPGQPTVGGVGTSLVGTYGRLTLQADGSYQYVADTAATDALAVGVVQQDTFRYVVSDNHGATDTAVLVISVTGTNDLPMVTAATASVMEAALVTDTLGVLATASDVDGDSLQITAFASATDVATQGTPGGTLAGAFGHLTLNPDGSYAYMADTAASAALGLGQTAQDIFIYTVSDGKGGFASETLTITVQGTVDAPLIQATADTISLLESTARPHTLFNTGVDDEGNALQQGLIDQHYDITQAPTGSTLTLAATGMPGTWVGNDADSRWIGTTTADTTQLLTGEYRFQTHFDIGTDLDPSQVAISFDIAADNMLMDILINGQSTNIAIGTTSQNAFTYFTHIDLGAYSQLFIPGDNTLTFVVYNAYDRTINGYDEGGATGLRIDNVQTNLPITFDLACSATGGVLSNDTGADPSLVVQGVSVAGTTPDPAQIGQLINGAWGQLQMNADGSYNYIANQANQLAAGQQVAEIFNYVVADGQGNTAVSTLTINLTGTNDTALIGGTQAGSVTEELFTNTTGHLNVYDPDAGQSAFITQNATTGQYGNFSLDSNGNWSYSLDSANPTVAALNSGQSLSEQFVISTLDGTTTTVTLQINGLDGQSPLILDLNGDGVRSVGTDQGVTFDIDANGTLDHTGWASAQDGILALDLNHDQIINDGSELFGNHTRLADGSAARDGFQALAQYDSNLDGIIDARDAVFNDLMVWRDANQDGISQTNELTHLKEAGVQSLNLGYQQGTQMMAGNLHAEVGSYVDTQGTQHDMTDVWFQTQPASPVEGQTVWHVEGQERLSSITGFNAHTDTLDLRDLLKTHNGSLDEYLHVEKQGNDTRIDIRGDDKATVTNSVVLHNVDLLGDFASEQQAIRDLLSKNPLMPD